MNVATLINNPVPGVVPRITELHREYYTKHHNLGDVFVDQVHDGLMNFIKKFDNTRDGIWLISYNGEIEGSIVIQCDEKSPERAHIRWFILSETLNGLGLGGRLVNAAVEHCKNYGYAKIGLWTFEGLNAARYLYEKAGFKLTHQASGNQWGKNLNEQYFELEIEPDKITSMHKLMVITEEK